ncbi:MAG: RNA polymerase sigma factor [Saccharofermentanales bacterium]
MSANNDRVSEAVEKYGDMIRRICFLNLKNKADVEDIFQEVFLKLLLHTEPFENEEHERGWLCRVTFNQCKDLHKSFWRRKVESIEDMDIPYECPEQSEEILAVLSLPHDWKQIIYLHYYEEMTIPEIAALLKKNKNTVYTNLRRAKASLKANLEEEFLHGRL